MRTGMRAVDPDALTDTTRGQTVGSTLFVPVNILSNRFLQLTSLCLAHNTCDGLRFVGV